MEKNKIGHKPSKQFTLDNFTKYILKHRDKNRKSNEILAERVTSHRKQILLTKIYLENNVKWIVLKVDFKLLPNTKVFSKIKSNLWFDNKKVKSILFNILHSFNSTDEFNLKVTLDSNGITPGLHLVKVEMKEVTSLTKNQIYVVKETLVDFKKQNKVSKLRKIQLIKKVEGQDIVIISNKEGDITGVIEANMKRDFLSKRDVW